MLATASHEQRSSRVIAVLSIRLGSQAIKSSKSRVKRAAGHAQGTCSIRTRLQAPQASRRIAARRNTLVRPGPGRARTVPTGRRRPASTRHKAAQPLGSAGQVDNHAVGGEHNADGVGTGIESILLNAVVARTGRSRRRSG